MTTPSPTAVPLIDRVSELGRLRTMAEEMLADGSGRLVAVVGARGVGKSRVAGAFATWCAERGMVVLTAQCVGRAAEPLLPIRDALRPVLGTTARAVRGVLRRAAPDLLEGVPVVGKFLAGLGRELSAGPQVGGDTPRGLYDVLSTVIVKLGGEQGLLLLIEDAHVADPDTLSFLTYLLNKSREQPALIVVTVPAEEAGNPAIADYLSEWEEKGADTLRVGPFARADVGTYLETVLGAGAVDESTVDFMVGFTGGNALLLGESVRHLTTAGGLSRLTGGPAEVPDRIRRLLERRLTRLDEQTRAFVGVAAVVGEASHELTPIVRVLGVDDTTGLAALGRSCAAGVLSEEDDGRIVFTSELLRMVAYAQLPANHRRSLHLRAGEWFADQQQYSEAAHHYERGGDWRRMLPVAFLAAGAAEHVGLYHAAVWWYRRIQPHASPPDLFPRLANALLVVGEWAEAERLLDALPTDEPATLMLRSRLCFVRGDITGAAEHARRALGGEPAEDVEALTCLASINLYAGDFATAAGYAERAQRIARAAGSVNDQARCHILRGACLLYNGDPAAAEQAFRDGIWLLDSAPPATRGVGVYSALLGNRGFAEEVRGAWPEADASHREALRLRREVADAVGELESTLAVGRVALGLGDPATAGQFLTAAQRLAEDLGEELQQAKIIHARGELAATTGDTSAAVDFVHDARSRFIKCGTPYDIAFADLSLARILADTRPREAIERLASGRAAVQARGFGLLRTLYPEVDPPLADRIHAGLLGYMAGDAFGLPWEGLPPQEIRPADLDDLPARGPWSSGDTSDDTALTRLVAEHLATARGLGDPEQFMRTVADRAAQIPGLGPSTRRAIERFTETGAADGGDSDTNGAPMRALPVGWAVPLADETRRRDWTLALTRPTHGGRAAQTAACVMSACAAWALEGAAPDLLALIAAEEAAAVGPDTEVATALDEVRRGGWTPPAAGIGLDPAQTVAAALHCCLASGGDLDAALRLAVDLGGDTDTVAALTGGLLASRLRPGEVRQRLAWLGRVRLPADDDTGRLATALAGIRVAGDG